MAKGCKKHKGGIPKLNKVMSNLPENQGSSGRHKCPYCAYLEGVVAGKAAEKRRVAKLLGL